MVGHTGAFDATVVAVESVDLQLARLLKVIDELKGILVVTADHGNADEMYQRNPDGTVSRDRETGVPVLKTSHTLNPVPFMIHDAARDTRTIRYDVPSGEGDGAGIANVTSTCLELLGFQAPWDYQPSLVRFL
jgi:2,3-bisphosphoglycerate-independent phosphoglycerate mutase